MSGVLASGAGVVLRRFHASDLEAFLGWRCDPEVARFQSWAPMDRAQAAAFLAEVATAPIPAPGQWSQIAVALPDGQAVGDMGLFLSEDGTEGEIGISLARRVQGRGLGREALHAALAFMFENSDMARCLLWSDARNDASLGLIRSIGARPAGQEETAQPDGSALLEYCFEVERNAYPRAR